MSTESPASESIVIPLAAAPVAISPEREAKNLRFSTRVWCAFTTAISGGMLGVGHWLTPSPTGVETHRQLGLPPCGFYHMTGLPCPTCGCTTAVSHVAHGQFLSAIITQPFGAAVGFLGIFLLMLSPIGMVTGKWLGPQPFTLSYHWQKIVYGSLILLGAAWVYKCIMVTNHWG
jgi:hypothetical protein